MVLSQGYQSLMTGSTSLPNRPMLDIVESRDIVAAFNPVPHSCGAGTEHSGCDIADAIPRIQVWWPTPPPLPARQICGQHRRHTRLTGTVLPPCTPLPRAILSHKSGCHSYSTA